MLNGKSGASGPNALPLVVTDQHSEHGHVVEHSLEETSNVLGNLQRLGNARHPSVQVLSSKMFHIFSVTRRSRSDTGQSVSQR